MRQTEPDPLYTASCEACGRPCYPTPGRAHVLCDSCAPLLVRALAAENDLAALRLEHERVLAALQARENEA